MHSVTFVGPYTFSRRAGSHPQVMGPASLPFSFFAGDPPVGPPCVTTPFPMTSMTLLAKSSVMSAGRGWPPSLRNLHSRYVHLPNTLDQQRNGLPVACMYFGRVGRSVSVFPAAARISAKCTLPFVGSRYPCMRALSLWFLASVHPIRQSRKPCCPPACGY